MIGIGRILQARQTLAVLLIALVLAIVINAITGGATRWAVQLGNNEG